MLPGETIKEQTFVETNSLIYLFMDTSAGRNVMRAQTSTANTFGLQVGVQTGHELLILRRITDEAGVEELDHFADERAEG